MVKDRAEGDTNDTEHTDECRAQDEGVKLPTPPPDHVTVPSGE
jgi:hypothetical protein